MGRRLRIVMLAALVAPGLAGCANELAQRQAFLATLVGKSEADLVRTMGVPDRTVEAGGHRFLAYEERRIQVLPGSYFGPWGWGYGGWGYGGGLPPQVVSLTCEMTFEIGDGRVVGYSLRGNACG